MKDLMDKLKKVETAIEKLPLSERGSVYPYKEPSKRASILLEKRSYLRSLIPY